ncbi:hypothetical protein Tco_0800206 [Tanacetum coccineum]|uniref:Uncharacterized protein n=1 Tax=Tanacetum coccineum TaxID=301880 RepID=A0ABQ4ZSG1_9ASTR
MSSLDRSNTTISDPYKGLAVITSLLKDINNAVKDDPAANQKINKATDTFKRISSNIIEVLSLVKGFDFSVLLSPMKDLQAHALKQDEGLAAWAKSSTNMAWTLAFKGQPSFAPSGSVTPTLALTHILANVEGENVTNIATEEPPSHTKGETEDTTMEIPISSIQPTKVQPTHDQQITSIISHPESSQETLIIDKGKVRVEFLINGKIVYHTEQEIQEYWDKEEKMKKAAEEAKLLAMSRPEVIKKKKNSVVKDLMISLSKIYERLKKIPNELGIQSALPAPVPEQASSQTSGRKRNHMELKPEVKVPGLEYNRSLPEGIPFVNNMVIKEPEYEIFFTDVFGDQAFQRWDDIYKVGMESLVSYLVMASVVKTEENARFSLKLRKLIVDHPNQEKLKSKKVKLEALGYHLE